jgi:uncharacterized protein
MPADLNAALLEPEIDRLDTFLAELDGPVNSFEGLDGLFCALICAPTAIMPSQYVKVILGDSAFTDADQAKDISSLMAQHWNTVAKTLQQVSKVGDVYVPALLVDDDGNPTGNEWAEGFVLGLTLTQNDWHAFSQNTELGDLLEPVMLLAHEHHPDPTLRTTTLSTEGRDDLLDEMFDNLMLIYEHFQRQVN